MANDDIFDSSIRSAGDLAGVFEYDGETGCFYLYETKGDEGRKVVGSIHVLSGEPDFAEADVSVRWEPAENKVGLFIRGVLWAVFDSHRMKYGGNYKAGSSPSVPSETARAFDRNDPAT